MTQNLEVVIAKIREGDITPEQGVTAFESPAVHVKDIEFALSTQVVESGLESLDNYEFLKKDRSELIILGARPSMGKSALMFQIGAHVARTANVLLYSLEMDKESIMRRLVASFASKDIRKLAMLDHRADVIKARKEIDALKMYIDDRGGLDINTIRDSATAFNRKFPVALVIVDYLQLVKSREFGNRNNEIGEVTAGLKSLAKQLRCPVLVGSQLNRECERRGKDQRSGNFGDYKPILSDLRDSGNIEQDADVIMFLSRQEIYDGTRPGTADVRIAKNRNGEVGDIVLGFSGFQTKFMDRGMDL